MFYEEDKNPVGPSLGHGEEGAPPANEEVERPDRDAKSVSKLKMLEEFLRFDYEFRFNVITGAPEYRPLKETSGRWRRMDDYKLNSIVRNMKLSGLTWASRTRLGEIIESDFARAVNPIEEYFERLPQESGRDAIGELAATVKTTAPGDMFRRMLQKWLVGAVANVFEKHRCANQLCFILTGAQGAFKSTWIRLLCPSALKRYYYEGDLDPANKDHLFATTSHFIYNLDDHFASVTKKKINELKAFITLNTVNARRPYARYNEELPKICSFIGSSNEQTFLYDSTGSRRFLPFEVTAIEIAKAQKIEIDGVWAQAFKIYRSGASYWLTREEQRELERYNEQFQVQSYEYELITTYFEVPESDDLADAFLTNTDISNLLESKTRKPISTRRLGEALKAAGFQRVQKREGKFRRWVYPVIQVSDFDVSAAKASPPE